MFFRYLLFEGDVIFFFFFSSRRRHTRFDCDWSSDVCSSDLYGRLLIIGGSENFTGAPAFSALAATKCGTDLVYVASPTKTSEIIASYSPDLITIKLPGEHLNLKDLPEIERWMTSSDAIVLGP